MSVTDNRDTIPDMAMNLPTMGPELPDGPFDLPIDSEGLPIPRMTVLPATGPAYDVQVYGSDMINFEKTAVRHRWVGMGPQAAPMHYTYFLAWSASRREGRTALTWEEFESSTRFVKDVSTGRAGPTGPGPGPG